MATEVQMVRAEEANVRAVRDCEVLRKQISSPPIRQLMRVIPFKQVPLRVSKFDVALKAAPLRAVHAAQTILTRMVMFRCLVCNERFPTFHPAYEPPADLDLFLLKRQAGGVPHCNMEVASWTELPPFEEDAETGIARRCTGTCLACHKDIEAQSRRQQDGGQEDSVPVPRRSYLNVMDPLWNFPKQFAWLFRQATVTESCLVALDFMQVYFCTVRKTMMHVFKKNTISFPQDIGNFFGRMGAMKQFRVGARVNSTRGPGPNAADPDRSSRVWTEASVDDQRRFAKDGNGRMLFAATVVGVRSNGDLVVSYDQAGDSDAQGVERSENVTSRIQMPWEPRQIQENLVILLRRNVGYGQVLEGLEVRLVLVSKIIRALSSYPELHALPWREGGQWREPMHKYYDPRLFDVLDEEKVLARYAPRRYKGVCGSCKSRRA
jgi:hypothetical protein